ncbi:MAG: DUF4493 domain-containing protein [Candidatus Cryptobacteroides sp.]
MKKIFIFVAALAAMTACNKNVFSPAISEEDYGFISLGLDADTEIVTTKASTTVTKEESGYNVTLYKHNGSAFDAVWTKEYKDIQDSDLKVVAGTYKIYAENYTEAESLSANENYGAVRVTGSSEEFTVTAGGTSQANVACTPVNAKVSTAYAEGFTATFTNPSVSISDASRNLTMTPYDESTKTGSIAYFSESTSSINYSLTATVNSVQKTWKGTSNITARKWNKITFSSTNKGSITITITADDEITDVATVSVDLDPLDGEQNSGSDE